MESREHIHLVQVAVNCVRQLLPRDWHPLIEADTADTPQPTRIVGNFIPDVFFYHQELLIIGEAKTAEDFARPHSQQQFAAYLQECRKFPGQSLLIVSVPWNIVPGAKNYFRRQSAMSKGNFRLIIVNELGEQFEL